MRIVVALGGNALLQRDEPPTAANQRQNVRIAARALAPLSEGNQLLISHGNGPQVGLLALQAEHFNREEPIPLDVLGAQTEGMIGYMIEQELGNLLPFEQPLATILTMVEVDPADPAFQKPTKPIGPVYSERQARRLAARRGWSIAADRGGYRRVVPSPRPKRIFEIRPIRWLLDQGVIVVCTGGGGIPTAYAADGTLRGAEVVVDKDLASAVLAREVGAERLILATDVEGVFLDWGTPEQRLLDRVTPDELDGLDLAAGSMGPKVEAAATFVRETGGVAAIGALEDLQRLAAGEAGTQVVPATRS
ncbi:MAG: carbamate kinase [Thermoanaerobaculia bacterium]|nr:carbamate kinase [Thermoanaerobaculia bacterium]